jgi:hypothetical protein
MEKSSSYMAGLGKDNGSSYMAALEGQLAALDKDKWQLLHSRS